MVRVTGCCEASSSHISSLSNLLHRLLPRVNPTVPTRPTSCAPRTPKVFVEQCRELDIAIALAPRGTTSLAQQLQRRARAQQQQQMQMQQQQQQAGRGAGKQLAVLADKFGKSINSLVQDLKSPKMPPGGNRDDSALLSATGVGSGMGSSMGGQRDLRTLSNPLQGRSGQSTSLHGGLTAGSVGGVSSAPQQPPLVDALGPLPPVSVHNCTVRYGVCVPHVDVYVPGLRRVVHAWCS